MAPQLTLTGTVRVEMAARHEHRDDHDPDVDDGEPDPLEQAGGADGE